MKRVIDLILRAAIVFSLFLIPAAFVLSGSVLTRVLDSVLHLKVDPRFSGGRELSRFRDPSGDDHGDGGLTYPDGGGSREGALDILTYMVFEPVTGTALSGERGFWQLGVTLLRFENPQGAPNGFSLPSIRIYVDTDGAASGSVETAASRAELVSFDPSAPWDVSVTIDGWHDRALMRTADGKIQRRIPLITVPGRKSVYVRLPLDVPEVRRVLDGRQTGHYVMTCGYDPLTLDGVMRVKRFPTRNEGGGALSGSTPRVFDVLATDEGVQEGMLSLYGKAASRYAVLKPVVCGTGGKVDGAAIRP